MACRVAGCDKPLLAKGACQTHYDMWRRYGREDIRPVSAQCSDCGNEFRVPTRGNVPNACKPCQIERHAKAMKADRWRKALKYDYGMTREQYFEMLSAQGGTCAICHGQPTGRGSVLGRFSVDHDHQTGRIRGLLCNHCNSGLGLFRENTQFLKSASEYLEVHHGSTV